MFYRIKKTRKYQAPAAKVTHLELENSVCNNVESVRFNIQVNDFEVVNEKSAEEVLYFES